MLRTASSMLAVSNVTVFQPALNSWLKCIFQKRVQFLIWKAETKIYLLCSSEIIYYIYFFLCVFQICPRLWLSEPCTCAVYLWDQRVLFCNSLKSSTVFMAWYFWLKIKKNQLTTLFFPGRCHVVHGSVMSALSHVVENKSHCGFQIVFDLFT